MSRPLIRSAPPRRPVRGGRRLRALGLAAAAALAVAALALDLGPRAAASPPDGAAARHALAAGERLRAYVEAGAGEGELGLSEDEVNALLASLGRIVPGIAGAAQVGGDGLRVVLGAGPPHLPLGLWANLTVELAAPADGVRVASARLGALPLPPALVEAAAARALDRALGAPGLGRMALDGVAGLWVEGDRAVAAMAFSPEARSALLARLRARLDVAGAGPEGEPARRQLYWLNRGGAEGDLPRQGSVLPWLVAMLDRADRIAVRLPDVSDRDQMLGGILALAVYCGEPALAPALGVTLTERMTGDGNACEGATLGGRADLRRHFLVSAGLYAASTARAALGVGELKELMDSAGGTGFSFDDMAANLAGARFAATLLAAPRQAWPAYAALLTDEAAVLPPLEGLPSRLDAATFREDFGDVESPAYRAMIAEIEARVEALPFHQAGAGG